MNLTTLELDTIYFYFVKLGHFIPTVKIQGIPRNVTLTVLNVFFYDLLTSLKAKTIILKSHDRHISVKLIAK